MMNKKNYIIIVILVIVLISLCGYIYFKKNKSDDSEIDSTLELSESDQISSSSLDNGDEKIDWTSYDSNDITLTGSIKITEGGVYYLTGTISDGLISIDTKDSVKLVLNNVNITNSSGPAIVVISAENVVIETSENSKNYLTDGSSYSSSNQEYDGVIFSKDDLVLQGNGSLEIKANYQDGIVSKDDLKIISGTYIINSNDDGIRGKDSVYIVDGTFTINSKGDAIKTTNDTDSDKGFIYIEKGTFDITSEQDGISSILKTVIDAGTFNITTGGGSSNSSTNNSNWGRWGNSNTTSNNTSSAKGIKSDGSITINGGTFTLNTSDDSIHSNNNVNIINGVINITSGDDGIHADENVIIENGTINISKSYEGIESANIAINNGIISVAASDDGINVANGDGSNMGRPGENSTNSSSNSKLVINGGTIYVNSTGDGIDVNGSAYIYGGTITVDGPTNDGNGALDYDGQFIMNGGSLIAVGSSGMLQGVSSNSTQYSVTAALSNISANSTISIVDGNNNEIISYKNSKSCAAIVVSSSKFEKGQNYSIVVNGNTVQTFTVNSITTTVGNVNSGMPGGQRGGSWR